MDILFQEVNFAYSAKKTREETLHSCSFFVREGERVVLLGPSGSGKSTIAKLTAGLLRANTGTISIGNNIVDGPSNFVKPSQRNLAMLLQSSPLYPHMTVRKNMAFWPVNRGASMHEVADRVEVVAQYLGISSLLDRFPNQISGGEKQRVALASAVIMPDQPICILDEPLASLDTHLWGTLQTELLNFFQGSGKTVLYVTHDRAEAVRIANRIVVMNNGNVMQVGTFRQLYDDPVSLFVARFMGNLERIEGGWSSNQSAGRQVWIRPEDIVLDDVSGMPAKVLSVTDFGPSSLVTLVLENGQSIAVPVKHDLLQNEYFIKFPRDRVLWFDDQGRRIQSDE